MKNVVVYIKLADIDVDILPANFVLCFGI